jgi:hypothetical protein
MKKVALAALLIGLVPAAWATEPTPAPGLPSWMTGFWRVQEENGNWAEEWWTTPRAGVMLGAGRSGKGDTLEWWEQTRIESVGGRLSFCALPKGQKGACFAATKVDQLEVVFENPAHDFPTKVAYRRVGNELLAEVSGPGGANPQRWRFTKAN